MDHYKWNKEKNERFKTEHGMSFEQTIMHIERGDVLDSEYFLKFWRKFKLLL